VKVARQCPLVFLAKGRLKRRFSMIFQVLTVTSKSMKMAKAHRPDDGGSKLL
jgi:hypothetical protein